MELMVVHILVLFLLLLGTFICGTLPILCFKYSKCFSDGNGGNRVTAFLIFFGGGVLMTTCFLHLLPEARESFPSTTHDEEHPVSKAHEEAKGGHNTTITSSAEAQDAHSHESFALPEFLVLCGLFATYLIEEIIHSFFVRFRGHDVAHHIGAKLCTCAQRDTECSRVYKDVKPNSSLFSAEKKDDQSNAAKTPHQELDPSSHLHIKIAQSDFPNYGSVSAGPSAVEACDISPVDPIVAAPILTTCEGNVQNNISLTSLLTVCALSFHSIFEGFAIGFQRTVLGTWTIFIAVAVHKFVIAFVIGIEVMFESRAPSVVFAYMSVFSCMSPIGMAVAIFTGVNLHETSNMIVGVLNCVATGTLLYVTFFEIIPRKTSSHFLGWWKFCAIAFGAGLMTLVQYVTTIL